MNSTKMIFVVVINDDDGVIIASINLVETARIDSACDQIIACHSLVTTPVSGCVR